MKEDAGSRIISPLEVSDQEKEGEEMGTILPNPLPSSPAQGSTSTPDQALTRMQRFRAFRRRARTKHGTVFGLGYVFVVFPLILLFAAFNMLHGETLGDGILQVPTFIHPPMMTAVQHLDLGCVYR